MDRHDSAARPPVLSTPPHHPTWCEAGAADRDEALTKTKPNKPSPKPNCDDAPPSTRRRQRLSRPSRRFAERSRIPSATKPRLPRESSDWSDRRRRGQASTPTDNDLPSRSIDRALPDPPSPSSSLDSSGSTLRRCNHRRKMQSWKGANKSTRQS